MSSCFLSPRAVTGCARTHLPTYSSVPLAHTLVSTCALPGPRMQRLQRLSSALGRVPVRGQARKVVAVHTGPTQRVKGQTCRQEAWAAPGAYGCCSLWVCGSISTRRPKGAV